VSEIFWCILNFSCTACIAVTKKNRDKHVTFDGRPLSKHWRNVYYYVWDFEKVVDIHELWSFNCSFSVYCGFHASVCLSVTRQMSHAAAAAGTLLSEYIHQLGLSSSCPVALYPSRAVIMTSQLSMWRHREAEASCGEISAVQGFLMMSSPSAVDVNSCLIFAEKVKVNEITSRGFVNLISASVNIILTVYNLKSTSK